jgi:hypothetical protein
MKKIYLSLLLALSITGTTKLIAQTGVAINTDATSADASAMLDVKATGKGVLVPRMTLALRPATPATGLLIYQTDGTAGFYYYSGAAWIYIQNSGNANITTQGNTFNGASQLVQMTAATKLPAVDGSLLTTLNASGLASGTVATGRLGSGTAGSTNFLRGDATWATPVPIISSILLKNINYAVSISDVMIYTTTGNVTYTLPSAASAGAGKVFYMMAANTNLLTVATAGGDAMLIPYNSGTYTTTATLGSGFGGYTWISDGVNRWIAIVMF